MFTSISAGEFCNIIMTGEPTHTASKERMAPKLILSSECVPQLSNTALQQSSHHNDSCAPTINYCLESATAITLRFQLFSACYTALQMKDSVRIVSAINPVTTENTDNSC